MCERDQNCFFTHIIFQKCVYLKKINYLIKYFKKRYYLVFTYKIMNNSKDIQENVKSNEIKDDKIGY